MATDAQDRSQRTHLPPLRVVVERQGVSLNLQSASYVYKVCRESAQKCRSLDAPGKDTQGELEDSLFLSSE